MNDVGTVVWDAPEESGSSSWYVYEAKWVTTPTLLLVPEAAGLALEWRTNFTGFHVEYATNLAPSAVWGRLAGSATPVGGYFHQSIGQALGGTAFFRLSTSNN